MPGVVARITQNMAPMVPITEGDKPTKMAFDFFAPLYIVRSWLFVGCIWSLVFLIASFNLMDLAFLLEIPGAPDVAQHLRRRFKSFSWAKMAHRRQPVGSEKVFQRSSRESQSLLEAADDRQKQTAAVSGDRNKGDSQLFADIKYSLRVSLVHYFAMFISILAWTYLLQRVLVFAWSSNCQILLIVVSGSLAKVSLLWDSCTSLAKAPKGQS